jgi:5'-methylthioadenosine phosphorylase
VYWQTTGPRFETAAEVRMIAAFADVVGMTIGSECVASRELGLAYAAVCVVDNLANGVADTPLTVEEFEAGRAANAAALTETLRRVVPELAG